MRRLRMRYRQWRLNYHAAQVRRLMGLPRKSPWRSQLASERDWEYETK